MENPLTPETLRRLSLAAREAASFAYCPYSSFPVGAAVLTSTGEIFPGCNIENASFGLTLCAERTALFRAISSGHRSILALAIYTPTPAPITPCGACRQVLNEFAPNLFIISLCDTPEILQTTLPILLPQAFGPISLSPIAS